MPSLKVDRDKVGAKCLHADKSHMRNHLWEPMRTE